MLIFQPGDCADVWGDVGLKVLSATNIKFVVFWGMKLREFWQICTNISEERTAAIYSVERGRRHIVIQEQLQDSDIAAT